MNSRLTKLQKMQTILSKKAKAAREAQRKLNQEKRSLMKQINQETLMQLALTVQKTGFPIENLSLITGLAIYGKELLAKQDDPAVKAEIVSYMKRYDQFVQELKKHPEEATSDAEDFTENGDDDE